MHYTKGKDWTLPYSIDWSLVEQVQEVAEVVDGQWQLTRAGVRMAAPYYDRVLAVGDANWTDYEVLVDVTYHKLFGDLEGRNLRGPP